ncbi:rRNA maturation RNase YbeY [Inmirania thermothiophila]|uniref:Endoribonuclease YbeY n=1 Tax=Inmirania thermothiophila TaxID=1750597 RepID=A0A3N1YBV2_9GAMM|nr:rRNA maturation RNase YbeY [Inmirania thermothiophila]ROR34857.1 putative rRNA maturation factor [Inmirania thermothiophila]
MSVEIVIQRAAPGGPGDEALRAWAQAALAGREAEGELVIRIVDEAEGAELNRAWRGKDGPTNVLSFPHAPGTGLLGDIVLCAPVAAREAAEQGKPEAAHWAHLVVHGVLHVLGHDHQEEAEAARMEGLEREILGRLGFPDPYAEEAGA